MRNGNGNGKGNGKGKGKGNGKGRPIVALTASALDLEKAGCATAGIDDLIAKPVTASTLHGRKLDALKNGRR